MHIILTPYMYHMLYIYTYLYTKYTHTLTCTHIQLHILRRHNSDPGVKTPLRFPVKSILTLQPTSSLCISLCFRVNF